MGMPFNYCKKIKCIYILLLVLLILVAKPVQANQKDKSKKAKKENKLVITGVLLRSDRSPMVGETVYCFKVEEGSISLRFKDGMAINPSGVTDSKGKFVIEVKPPPVGEKFTVGINRLGPVGLSRGDIPINLKIDKETKNIDLGEIIFEWKQSNQSLG